MNYRDFILNPEEVASLQASGAITIIPKRRGRPPKPKPYEKWRAFGRRFTPETLCCDKCYSVVARLTSNQKYCAPCGAQTRKQQQRDWRLRHGLPQT